MPTETDCAYAAGIIDGEGSINIARKFNRKGQPNYGVTVEVKMTDENIILWFLLTFGGRKRKPQNRTGKGWKTSYSWFCSGPFAASFLKLIISHLKTKKLRSEYAIQLGESTWPRRNGKGQRGFRYLTDEERAKREALAYSIRRENCKGSKVAELNSRWGAN